MMYSPTPLALDKVHSRLPNSNFRRARPCRVYWRYKGKYAVQFFPRGAVQLLGRVPEAIWYEVHQFLQDSLHLTLSAPNLCTCTVACRISHRLTHLSTLPSNHLVCNEKELFPGTLIRHPVKNRQFHTSLFPNGTAVITGTTSLLEAYTQLNACLSHHKIIE